MSGIRRCSCEVIPFFFFCVAAADQPVAAPDCDPSLRSEQPSCDPSLRSEQPSRPRRQPPKFVLLGPHAGAIQNTHTNNKHAERKAHRRRDKSGASAREAWNRLEVEENKCGQTALAA